MSKDFEFIEEDDFLDESEEYYPETELNEDKAKQLIQSPFQEDADIPIPEIAGCSRESPDSEQSENSFITINDEFLNKSSPEIISKKTKKREKSKKPPDSEEDSGSFADTLTAIFIDKSPKGKAKKWLIFFIPLLYASWLLGQRLVVLQYDNLTASYFPPTLVYNMLHNITLMMIMAIAVGVIASVFVSVMDKEITERKAWELSQNTTHGSATLANDENIKGAVEFDDIDDPKGVCLGRKIENNDQKSVCVTKDLGRNMNFAIFGSSGAGKSYSFSRPNILTRISSGDSYIVTDPSGELYTDTAALAEKMGYEVKVLNLKDPTASNGWNPLDILIDSNSIMIQMKTATLVHTILANTTEEGAKGDAFFDQSEENLLKALILYVAVSKNFKGEPYERHLGTVYDLLTKLAAQEGILEEFNELPDDDPAKSAWKMFQGAGKLKVNFITGLASRIEIFQSDIIKEMFSHSEINLALPGEKKCAYYIISSVSSDKMRFLLSLFFSCAFEQLMTAAENNKTGKLDVPVYFILDEFKAIGQINSFGDKVANVRKYGISIAMIFQDLNQLEIAYPRDFESILSNCDTWLTLGVNDMKTAKMLSERSGVATVVSHSYSESQVKRPILTQYTPTQNVSTSDQKRYIMTPDEIMTYFGVEGNGPRKAILFARGKYAYCMNSYDWHLHRLAHYVGSEGYVRHANEYIPPWQNGEWNINKKRTFLSLDYPNGSGSSFGQIVGSPLLKSNPVRRTDQAPAKSQDEVKEEARKKGGIVFNAEARSKHLVDLGLDLSNSGK